MLDNNLSCFGGLQMARIEWVDSFSVGNDELDEQHKTLLNQTHISYEICMKGAKFEDLKK